VENVKDVKAEVLVVGTSTCLENLMKMMKWEREMSRTFSEQFKNIKNKVPKDLIKEYDTPEGGKVREKLVQ